MNDRTLKYKIIAAQDELLQAHVKKGADEFDRLVETANKLRQQLGMPPLFTSRPSPRNEGKGNFRVIQGGLYRPYDGLSKDFRTFLMKERTKPDHHANA